MYVSLTRNTGQNIDNTQKIGNISYVYDSFASYDSVNFKWSRTPNITQFHVIAAEIPESSPRYSANKSNIRFWKSTSFSEISFLTLVKRLFNQNFSSGLKAKEWLNNNGYWTSYDEGFYYNLSIDQNNGDPFSGQAKILSYNLGPILNPNIIHQANNGLTINTIDINGINRSSYFNNFISKSGILEISQGSNKAIYSFDSNALHSYSSYTGSLRVFGPLNSSTLRNYGTATLVQSSPNYFIEGPILISVKDPNQLVKIEGTTSLTEIRSSSNQNTQFQKLGPIGYIYISENATFPVAFKVSVSGGQTNKPAYGTSIIQDLITRDVFASGNCQSGVTYTPTFYNNTIEISNDYMYIFQPGVYRFSLQLQSFGVISGSQPQATISLADLSIYAPELALSGKSDTDMLNLYNGIDLYYPISSISGNNQNNKIIINNKAAQFILKLMANNNASNISGNLSLNIQDMNSINLSLDKNTPNRISPKTGSYNYIGKNLTGIEKKFSLPPGIYDYNFTTSNTSGTLYYAWCMDKNPYIINGLTFVVSNSRTNTGSIQINNAPATITLKSFGGTNVGQQINANLDIKYGNGHTGISSGTSYGNINATASSFQSNINTITINSNGLYTYTLTGTFSGSVGVRADIF